MFSLFNMVWKADYECRKYYHEEHGGQKGNTHQDLRVQNGIKPTSLIQQMKPLPVNCRFSNAGLCLHFINCIIMYKAYDANLEITVSNFKIKRHYMSYTGIDI